MRAGKEATQVPPKLWHGPAGLAQIAQLLWLPSYDRLFELELELNEQACGGGGGLLQLPPTTYRARLSGERAQRYDSRRQRQRRDELAIALHANNLCIFCITVIDYKMNARVCH